MIYTYIKVLLIVIGIFIFYPLSLYAHIHKLAIKQLEENVYISSEGYTIATKGCTQKTEGYDEVVLVYPEEGYSKKHMLIFIEPDKNEICLVKEVIKSKQFPKFIWQR